MDTKSKEKKGRIILSFTTTYKRHHLLYQSIPSLTNQSLKPDIILLNVRLTDFSKQERNEFVKWLEEKGISINDAEDIGPYTKLLPALSCADEDDLIITADDDMIYEKNWLKKLVHAHYNNPSRKLWVFLHELK